MPLDHLMTDIDPEDRKRWYEKFEETTEEVVRSRLSGGGYQAGDKAGEKRQAAFEWLYEKEDQRKKLATRRFRLVLWAGIASFIVSWLGIFIML